MKKLSPLSVEDDGNYYCLRECPFLKDTGAEGYCLLAKKKQRLPYYDGFLSTRKCQEKLKNIERLNKINSLNG
jgi:hypothetical protein